MVHFSEFTESIDTQPNLYLFVSQSRVPGLEFPLCICLETVCSKDKNNTFTSAIKSTVIKTITLQPIDSAFLKQNKAYVHM